MLLLHSVVAHDAAHTRCRVEVDASELFREPGGRVPAWVALEYMAQCAAAHGGLVARARGEAPRAGLLLGTRRLRLALEAFEPGSTLFVSARHRAGETGLLAFDCEVCDAAGGPALAEGRLHVYTFEAGRRA
jgi:predicted hotdog family 3-hydroxylacyl-ACP dehydratase